MISRRNTLIGIAAATGLISVGQKTTAGISLGSSQLTTVSDGSLKLPKSFLFEGLPEVELQQVLSQYGLNTNSFEPECNLALYQDGKNNVLFDVGSGPDFMPSAGSIANSLDAIGLSTEDITHVLFTHAHPDHIWGLLDDFDEPLFANAKYFMGRQEWDYWWNPETVNTIGDSRAAFAAGAKRRMEAIEDSVALFDDGDEVLSGISAVKSFGHTPGHMSFDIKGRVLVVGDAIGNQHVAFHYPEWPSGSDQEAEMGIKSRKMLLNRLANEQIQMVGFHLPNGGIGRVEKSGSAYRFIEGV